MAITASLETICRFWTKGHPQGECDGCRSCWRCGRPRRRRYQGHDQGGLERCHIIPKMIGGTDEPSNLVILCRRCHDDAPDVDDPTEMWEYIDAGDTESLAVLSEVISFAANLGTDPAHEEFLTKYPDVLPSVLAARFSRIGIDNANQGGISNSTRRWVYIGALKEFYGRVAHWKKHGSWCIVCQTDHTLPVQSKYWPKPEVRTGSGDY